MVGLVLAKTHKNAAVEKFTSTRIITNVVDVHTTMRGPTDVLTSTRWRNCQNKLFRCNNVSHDKLTC